MQSYLMIDTAEGTRALLHRGGEYFYDENLKNAGSETLMPMIDGLLKKANMYHIPSSSSFPTNGKRGRHSDGLYPL